MQINQNLTQIARTVFENALKEIYPANSVTSQMRVERGVLHVQQMDYNLEDYDSISVICIGKAAHSLASAGPLMAE